MAFTDPKKTQNNAIENNIPELQHLQRKIWQFCLKKRKNKSIWTTTSKKSKKTQTKSKKARFSGPSVERCDRFPAVINEVEASEAFCGSQSLRKNDEKKYLQNDNRKSPSFTIFSTVVVGTSSFMLHAYLFISVILVFAGVMAQSCFWSSERSRTK